MRVQTEATMNPDTDWDKSCYICQSVEFGRRIVGRNLCERHWQELLDEEPDYIYGWIDERANALGSDDETEN